VAKNIRRKHFRQRKARYFGKFVGNARGFGFVVREYGVDIFIPPQFTFGALHGDEVACEIITSYNNDIREVESDEGKEVGKIVEITKRTPMVGVFRSKGKGGVVRPLERKIPHAFVVPPKTVSRFGLVDGHRVIFSVKQYSFYDFDEMDIPCFITEVIGHVNDPGVDVLSLLYQADVPYEFELETMEEAIALPVEVHEKDTKRRLDLRNEVTFTIDGDDTKDIDDAISFHVNDQGNYILGVHIADVTHYVLEDSELDKSALERGTSIYLADRVIPMLPHKLSSGICSLFPNVDRLTLSCIMTIDTKGHVISYKITPSVIRSKRKWTYKEVQIMLDGGGNDFYWAEVFLKMDSLRDILWKKRMERGALDFNIPESKIRVDDLGMPLSIESYPRTKSTGIIEEFMILCNETIAEHFMKEQVPFVYRTHEFPTAEKLFALNAITQPLGFSAPQNINSPMALQRLLEKTIDTPSSYAVAMAVLHSLPQAKYTPNNPYHFGLASENYCHFTSPIRRYADLQIHRIIKAVHYGNDINHFKEYISAVCVHCSRAERIAETLERDVAQLKKVQYMAAYKGENFAGIVSGVTSWGVYVLLENTVDGLIPTASLQGYIYDKESGYYIMTHGKKQKKILRNGTPVKVKLIHADEEERRITFSLL